MTFKVGDRVRIINDDFADEKGYEVGQIGTITETFNATHIHYQVKSLNHDPLVTINAAHTYFDNEMEFARIRDTKIARKVYQGKFEKAEDGWLWLI